MNLTTLDIVRGELSQQKIKEGVVNLIKLILRSLIKYVDV